MVRNEACIFYIKCRFLQNSTKNKKELAASRNEYLKAKKEKKKAKWAEIEKEVDWSQQFCDTTEFFILPFQGEKEKGKWQNFSKKAFGKKGFVKKSIFKSPEEADGKVRAVEWGSFKMSFEPKYLWRGYLIMWSSRQVSNAMDEEEDGYGQMFCAPNHATTTMLILC